MSGNDGSRRQKKHTRKPLRHDLRIRRTHERLGGALISLIQEKPIDEVTVQEVLDRAAVGRSTFYVHYRNKDDLLLSRLEHFLELISTALSRRKEESLRVLPMSEMLEHIGSQRKLYRALADSGRLYDFFDLAQGYFERGIKQRLIESERLPHMSRRELSARSAALAGGAIALVRSWLDSETKESSRNIDELFHRIVWHGLQ